MEISTRTDLFSTIADDDLTLSYSGVFTDSMTDMIIGLSEAYLGTNRHMGKLKKKTSFLVAECFQNVVRHGTKEKELVPDSESSESFILRFKDKACYIASENTLPTKQVTALKDKLHEINKHEKQELKGLYKKILEGGDLSEKGGAGLGLIEMARKTENKLGFSFKLKDENSSVFTLLLVLHSENDDSKSENYDNVLSEVEELILLLREDRQFLFYQGEMEQDIMLPMIHIVEKNLGLHDEMYITRMRLYHASVEIMQNISHHSSLIDEKHTGSISVGQSDGAYFMRSSNPVSSLSKDYLDLLLTKLIKMDKEELNQEYRQKLTSRKKQGAYNSGLGFIDLARICKGWDYSFSKHTEDVYYFNYSITI
jgi:hypothetical protein